MSASSLAIQISQIHLVHDVTKARVVIHIGAAVRQSDREITLDGQDRGHKPLRLRFSQSNAQDSDERPIHLEIVQIDPQLVIRIDKEIVVGAGKIKHGSLITLEAAPPPREAGVLAPIQLHAPAPPPPLAIYRCELHASGRYSNPMIHAAWDTLIGPVQELNEDALGIYRGGNKPGEPQMFVLSDGVGGAEAGERVSEFAVKWMLRAFHQARQAQKRSGEFVDWLALLESAFRGANAEVRQFGRLSSAPAGSTLIAVILVGYEAYIAHVGDSRLYAWNGVALRQLTEDHVSFIGGNAARGATQQTLLLKAIGKGETIDPDVFMFRLQPDDRLILCSDGLYNRLTDEDIAESIQEGSALSLPERIFHKASEHFNDDNLSLISIRVFPAQSAERGKKQREPKPKSNPRVFYGYNSRWSMRLKAAGELATNPVAPMSYRVRRALRKAFTRDNVARYARYALAIGMTLLVVYVVVTLINANNTAQNQALGGISTPSGNMGGEVVGAGTPTLINTPIRTPTLVPTITQPAPTGIPTNAPPVIEATITLQTMPTITLPPAFSGG